MWSHCLLYHFPPALHLSYIQVTVGFLYLSLFFLRRSWATTVKPVEFTSLCKDNYNIYMTVRLLFTHTKGWKTYLQLELSSLLETTLKLQTTKQIIGDLLKSSCAFDIYVTVKIYRCFMLFRFPSALCRSDKRANWPQWLVFIDTHQYCPPSSSCCWLPEVNTTQTVDSTLISPKCRDGQTHYNQDIV